MKKLEPRVRAICNELIDEFIADGRCDAAARYTKYIPVRAIAHMLGIPEQDSDLFITWIHQILELGIERAGQALVGLEQADPRVGVCVRPSGEAVVAEHERTFR